jgi:hypothetical protein
VTSEEKVKKAYPRARIRWSEFQGCWVVSQRNRKGQKKLSDVWVNEQSAWHDALRRIEAERKGSK